MSYDFASFKTAFASNLAYDSETNARFVDMLPSAIDYAELRMQRDLDFLATVTRDHSKAFQIGVRNVSLPTSPYFITITGANVVTPAGTANPDSGVRVRMARVSLAFLEEVFPSVENYGVPSYFAMLDDHTMLVGPWPDKAYQVEFVGTARLPALYSEAAVNGNFMSLQLPDLYMAAAMVYGSGFMRNFGRQSDDPQMAVSWESQYQTLLKSAAVEEARRKRTALQA